MSAAHILMIEDDVQIRRFVRVALEDAGYCVVEAEGVKRGLIDAATRRPDLIIVDLGLPDGDGKRLIAEVRGWSDLPILVLSARDQEREKVAALDAGADDYLTKPFGVDELLARLRALLRRRSSTAADVIVRFGDVEVDLTRHEVRKRDEMVHLTPTEYRLLAALLKAKGAVLTYRQLLHDVWGPGYANRTHYLRVHMANLRQKLEDDPARPRYLITELQVGYRLIGI
ncbi:response regulator [Caldimonas taiwanensis]|uniref:response regulator n=1 Tax=Caldimonas taiwanensis TaxID=307483 RepID=UPI000785B890|nr:response regulator [Caldimonas taiwanensis]